jgi:hypothetical protein
MATITGMTAAAMEAIANDMIVGASINGSGHLILTQQDSSTIDAGNVMGPAGPTGPAGSNGTDGTTASLDYLAVHNPTAADWSNNAHKIQNVTPGATTGDVATYEQVALKSGTTFTGYVAPKVVNLTYASTIAIDASQGNHYRVTLTGLTAALGNPTNPVDGQRLVIEVLQDATGGRALSYGTAFEFSTSLASPTLSSGANVTDMLGFIYNATKAKWLFVAYISGFA